MHTEWSPADNSPAEGGAEESSMTGQAPAPSSFGTSGPGSHLEAGGTEDGEHVGDLADMTDVSLDRSDDMSDEISEDNGPDEDGPVADMAPGEEEIHRSAVDAVDGLLDEVELALSRLDDGTYGRCEECGEPIDDERLAELPIVRMCGQCEMPESSVAPGEAVTASAAHSSTAEPWA